MGWFARSEYSFQTVILRKGLLMKKPIIFLSFVVWIAALSGANMAQAEITAVQINPLAPTQFDPIEVITDGIETAGPVFINNAVFNVNGNNLQLDIHLEVGVLAVITPWSYTHNIGTLHVGTFDLTVNAIDDYTLFNTGTYTTSFEVVPEPASILMLAIGALFCRKRR